jgi:OOP family OmpA-OmpF porin
MSVALDGNEPLPVRFVAADLRFRHDSAELEAPTDRALDEVAAALQTHPAARVRVEGHTDNTGNPERNVALSQQRADAVKTYLTEHGAAADQIEATGYGQAKPLATNDTPEGRAQNRRTELVLVGR